MKFFKYTPKLNIVLFLALFILVLSGCGGNRFEKQMRAAHATVQNNLTQLKTELDRKQLPNVLLIEKYADALIQQKPDYNDIAQLLKKEATSEGKNYNKLVTRLAAVNLIPRNEREAEANVQELQMVNNAADPGIYNDSLVDVVNTLASMSDGQLASLNVPHTTGVGQQSGNALVGNPAYGSWQKDSSGTSFWAWYGMYSMFNNFVGGGRYNYNSWSSRPNSGYYNNYGRERYGSYNDVSRNRDLSRRHPSQYNKSARTSPRYSKTARRSSSYGGSRTSSSRSSSYGSSSRSSSYSSSRGFRSGK